MRIMLNWIFGIALVAGVVGVGTVVANAAPHEFREGYAQGYIPPCPGQGYVWVAGYDNGYGWVQGSWVFRGRYDNDRWFGFDRDRGARFDHERAFRNDGDRRYDGDRRFDRDDRRDWNRERGNDRYRSGGRERLQALEDLNEHH